MIPLLALVAASTTYAAIARFGKRSATPILLAVIFASLYGSVFFDLRLALPSTRLEAREWILSNIANHSRIVTFEEPIALPENLETIRDIEEHAPYFLTKKRAYLRDSDVLLSPSVPQYYVLTPAYFREGVPETLLVEDYDYLVISWWNAEERALRLRQGYELESFKEIELLARFPEKATETTESLDLPNNMRAPLFKLHRLTQNGPTIEVYRVR